MAVPKKTKRGAQQHATWDKSATGNFFTKSLPNGNKVQFKYDNESGQWMQQNTGEWGKAGWTPANVSQLPEEWQDEANEKATTLQAAYDNRMEADRQAGVDADIPGDVEAYKKFEGDQAENIAGLKDALGGLTDYADDTISTLRDEARANALDLTSQYGSRERQTLGLLDTMGDAARRDIEESFENRMTKIDSDLGSRGLGSSSVLGNLATGNERDKARSVMDLNEQISTQKANYLSSMRGEQLAYQERAGAYDQSLGLTGLNLGLNMRSNEATMPFNAQSNLSQNLYSMSTGQQQNRRDTQMFAMNWLGGLQTPYPQGGPFDTFKEFTLANQQEDMAEEMADAQETSAWIQGGSSIASSALPLF